MSTSFRKPVTINMQQLSPIKEEGGQSGNHKGETGDNSTLTKKREKEEENPVYMRKLSPNSKAYWIQKNINQGIRIQLDTIED